MKVIPDEIDVRNAWLIVLLAVLSLVGMVLLSEVIWTIFFASAFAYLIFPVKEKVLNYGFSNRQASAIATLLSFVSLVISITPFVVVMFHRRQILIEFLADLPEEINITLMEFTFSYSMPEIEAVAVEWINQAAVRFAEALPALSLKSFLFVFLLYAILEHHRSIEKRIIEIIPTNIEKVFYSYNTRIKRTLIGIFAVQGLTAVATFIIALPIFYLLGYSAFISLSLISAVLQFIPIVGPSMLVVALAALEFATGLPIKGIMILIFGLVVIGFLPDAYLRPKMAGRTTGLPASLYFIGFVGGALTIGVAGVLAGPLLIAVMLETVTLMTEAEEN
ncbi:MAG: putative PurR-regulated permease PerM [Candidatus Nanohaloarchaea archaeon]|jgi:predicted PurR-regulated permease PerM